MFSQITIFTFSNIIPKLNINFSGATISDSDDDISDILAVPNSTNTKNISNESSNKEALNNKSKNETRNETPDKTKSIENSDKNSSQENSQNGKIVKMIKLNFNTKFKKKFFFFKN